jgi:hypothetical protein
MFPLMVAGVKCLVLFPKREDEAKKFSLNSHVPFHFYTGSFIDPLVEAGESAYPVTHDAQCREEQNQLLEQLKAMVKKPGKKEELPPADEGPGKFYQGLDSIPPMESLEEFTRKYALKKEHLEPLKELFKDAPSAEELVKMLTK